MTAPIPARAVLLAGHGKTTHDRVALDYDGRFLRRKVLTTQGGARILVDLDQVVSLNDGDALACDDGTLVAVIAAPEPLIEVTGDGLIRLAWHIGNRHTPCEITASALRIRKDKVLGDMLIRLGAELGYVTAPFRPEGGAYGHGRTHGHSHGEAEGGQHHHRDVHAQTHDQPHAHPQGQGHGHTHAKSHDHDH